MLTLVVFGVIKTSIDACHSFPRCAVRWYKCGHGTIRAKNVFGDDHNRTSGLTGRLKHSFLTVIPTTPTLVLGWALCSTE